VIGLGGLLMDHLLLQVQLDLLYLVGAIGKGIQSIKWLKTLTKGTKWLDEVTGAGNIYR
jgi:hypothetical protein